MFVLTTTAKAVRGNCNDSPLMWIIAIGLAIFLVVNLIQEHKGGSK